MNYCPICEKKAVKIVKIKNASNLFFRYWLCNHCLKEFTEVVDMGGNVLYINVQESKDDTVQSTLNHFKRTLD